MKKKGSKKVLIILLIIVMLILSLFFVFKRYSLPSSIIKDSVLFINRFVRISNTDLEKENELLKEENEKLKIEVGESSELKEEVKKLKNALELNSLLSDKEIVCASVVNRNLDYWRDSLNIDKGSNDGISKNMAVVNNGYLVGIISDSSNSFSTVSLLTNDNFYLNLSVKIKVDDKYIYGILNNYKNGYYEVMGIVENIKISEGSSVITSGLSDYIPSGILIGSVDSVITDNFDLSKIVRVKPGVDFDDISYVSVIKGES